MLNFILTRVGILVFAIALASALFSMAVLVVDFTGKGIMAREAENIVLMLNKLNCFNGDAVIIYSSDTNCELLINDTENYIELNKENTKLKRFFSANTTYSKINLAKGKKFKFIKDKNLISVV